MKLHSIQYLRAFAAILVVLCHASTTLFRRERVLVDLEFGSYGVDVFFVVSGFIMLATTAEHPKSPGEFMVRRLVRIFPLYFLLTTLMLLLAFSVFRDSDTVSSDLPAYLLSILFIPHWNPKLHLLQPLVGQGWTLNYEMFFYAVFALGLFGAISTRLWVVTGALCLACVAGASYSGNNPLLLTYTNPLMLEFCLGLLLGNLHLRRKRPDAAASSASSWTTAALLIAGAVACFMLAPADGPYADGIRRWIRIGLPSGAILYLFVVLEDAGKIPEWRGLHRVGDASYSLYLIHTFVLGAGRRVWERLFDITTLGSHVAFIAVSAAVCIAAALALYRFVERPLTEILTRALQKRPVGVEGSAGN